MASFVNLPPELLLSVSDFLPICDFLNLLATSKGTKAVLDRQYPNRIRRAVIDYPRIFFAACFKGNVRVVREAISVVNVNSGISMALSKSRDNKPRSGDRRVYMPPVKDDEDEGMPVVGIMHYCRCSFDRLNLSLEDFFSQREDTQDHYSFVPLNYYVDEGIEDSEMYEDQFLEHQRPDDPDAPPQEHILG